MATVTVRVLPRSPGARVERREGEIVVRVHAPPVGGRATEEARRVLAEHLDLPVSRVILRSGGRSRVKVFEALGLTPEELEARLLDKR